MILEGIVTTTNEDGSANISPMGPIVDEAMQRFTLRPFQSSQTYQNLKRHPAGVLHVTDDVMLIARTAINQLLEEPKLIPVSSVSGFAIADACRWYAFKVDELLDDQQRTTIRCDVVEQCRQRDFFGFNRAKHAVIELAILATRVGILENEAITSQMTDLEIIVDKTAGSQEIAAFELLKQFITEKLR